MTAGQSTKTVRRPTADEWSLIQRHFDRLSDLPPADRAARLKKARLDDFVAGELGRMLAASDGAGVLDHPRADLPDAVADDGPSLPGGAIIGKFRIDHLIGRGGAGEVYLATRADDRFAQRVAVKLLRVDTPTGLAAFDAERALVATLEHPGIARLIDGGAAPDGRPYMVLEYIDGAPITAWCAVQATPLEARLALFLEVCDAVAYAHARLIVHQDIKPGNVLIDGRGHAKLLDFGVARIVEDNAPAPDGSEQPTMLTPGYAAPEQLRGGRTTTATDVYGLGGLLFELLTSRAPWKTSRALLPTILRRMGDGVLTAPSRVAASSEGLPVHPKRIAGDLDAIVIKAMQESPDDRYPGVVALADDVRRHLSRHPVAARPASPGYVARRFAQRNRWPLTFAAIAALALAGGGAGVAWQAHRTAIERDAARDRATRLEAANQAILLMFRDASDAARLKTVSVGDMVDGTTRRLLESMPPDSPEAGPTIAALADIYLITENNVDAQALVSGAMARGIGRANPVDWARLELKLGTILAMQGQSARAGRLLDVADNVWRSDPQAYRREIVETVGARAVIAKLAGRPEEAIALLSANMPEAQTVYFDEDRDYAGRIANLATLLADVGRLGDARDIVRSGQASMERSGRPPSGPSLGLLRLEADIVNRTGDPTDAADLIRRVIAMRRRYYGPSIALAVDLLHFARLSNQLGQPAPALAALDEAGPMAVDHFGPLSQPVIQIRIAKVEALARSGRAADARAALAAIDPAASHLLDKGVNEARYHRITALVAWASGDAATASHELAAADGIVAKLGHGADGARLEIAATRRATAAPPPRGTAP